MENALPPATVASLATISEDPSRASSVVVRRFVALIAGFVVLLGAIGLVLGNMGVAAPRLALSASVLGVLLLAYMLAPRYPRSAMGLVVGVIWSASAVNMWLFAGVHTSGMVFFTLSIAGAGWVLGRRWLFAISALTAAWIGVVAMAQYAGWHASTQLATPLHAAANWIAALVVVALFIDGARRELFVVRDRALVLADQVQQQLETTRLQHDELQVFLQSIPAAVVEYDADWKVRRCNQRYADFFGTRPDVLAGKRFEEFAAPELVEQTEGLKESLAKGRTCVTRMHYHPPLGAPVRWFELRCVPQMRGGVLYQSVVALTDITPVVQAEEALQDSNRELSTRVATQTQVIDAAQRELEVAQETMLRAEAKATIATLVASITHELNTPVGNSALLASSMTDAVRSLHRELEQGSLRRSTLEDTSTSLLDGMEMLGRNLERIKTLIGQFKQVSADQASEKRRSFELADVVSDTVQTMRPSLRQYPHSTQLALAPGLHMDSYPGAIDQIVINLINNAYLHAFADGRTGTVTVSVRAAADQVVLQVQDDGVGMRDEVRQRLFEPFFSTRFGDGGTGLGMCIVQHLAVKVLGGSVEVSSVPGQGTSFVVTLPRQAPEKA